MMKNFFARFQKFDVCFRCHLSFFALELVGHLFFQVRDDFALGQLKPRRVKYLSVVSIDMHFVPTLQGLVAKHHAQGATVL
jgi:hypothetical protein